MRGICGMGGRLEMSGELGVCTPGVTGTIALELFTDGGSVDRFSTYINLQSNKDKLSIGAVLLHTLLRGDERGTRHLKGD